MSNFDFLAKYWPDMAQLGKTAELYLYADPNGCIIKLGILAERIARELCAFEKLQLPEDCALSDRLRALKYADLLPQRIDSMFYTLRKARNEAVHMCLDSREQACTLLHLAFNLSCWFMEVYGDWSFLSPEFRLPEEAPKTEDYSSLLKAQEEKLDALAAEVAQIRTAASDAAGAARAEKSVQAAGQLALTPAETDCLGSDPVRLDVSLLSSVNYALQQNGISLVKSVTIENTTDVPIEHVDLHISASPAFALPFTQHIALLPPHKSVTVTAPRLLLNGEYLAGLTEKVTGLLYIRLRSEEKNIATDHVETTVFAFDQWHGLGLYPELLASFVTPNHPALASLLSRATEYLGKWTGDTSMDGYQSQDPNRVLQQAAAIFTAIKEEAIAYAVPPASFETAGQRVRLCDTLLQQKLGTCLDLALLYAACLEAAGLHPLLITAPGHIFTGLWLEDRMFPECIQDDYSLVTKRLASGVNEIAVVETTCVTTGKDLSFDDARAAAEQLMAAGRTEYILDVHRARMSGISPLPYRVQGSNGWEISHKAPVRKENPAAPAALDAAVTPAADTCDSDIPKKLQWERKLLDLGMRNTLINLRLTKTQLPILTNSLDELENALADGSDFTILPKPADLQLEDFSFETLCERNAAEIIRAEFENKRLRSVLTDSELKTTVKGLYRTAKTALEENGANTLYLALGMLRWFENKRSTKARYAPVILVPIEMVRKSAAQGYVIRLRDDEPQMNITLLEKLKQDFGIMVNGLDPLPADEHGIDIRRVLTVLRKAVMEQAHWDVLEAATIGIFSFSQFVMWNDIRNRTDDLLRNKVVHSLMEGKLCWDAQPLEMGDRVEENNVLLPMSADASQLYAIRAACEGESFVLHGPPGTGKSQTITSLIANALAQGKTVLFVAEKMAALEVVQKRLRKIGIGPFCLELHSNKSRKKDVLEQLRTASEVTKTRTAETYAAKARQLAALREELDAYVLELHKPLPCGSDVYQLISEYEGCKDAPELAPFSPAFIREQTGVSLDSILLLVERLVAAGRETGHPHNHPLSRIRCAQYTQNLRAELSEKAEGYIAQLEAMGGHVAVLSALLKEPQPCSFEQLCQLSELASHMSCWYDMPAAWTKAPSPQLYFDETEALAAHALRAEQLEAQLLEVFDAGILSLDGQQLFNEFAEASAKWFLPKALGLNKLTKRLNAYAKAPVSKDALRDQLIALRDQQQARKAAEPLLQKYAQDLGDFYQGKRTDWESISRLAASARTHALALQSLRGSCDLLHNHCGDPELYGAVLGLESGFGAFRSAKEAFYQLLGVQQAQQELWLEQELALCQTVLAHRDQLKEWIAYAGTAAEAAEAGLSNVVSSYEAGTSHDELLPAYKKAILQGLISDAIDTNPALNGFSGTLFSKKVEQFRQMDQQWAQLSQQEIYCRLAGKVPDFTREAAHSSELGILQRCIKSGGRGTSIRKLFDQIPNLLPRLCPCMLMSPISAAQYLDPKREPFDIVVFDEASQLPTCKAVGVLARGKDAIVVGDPKQMPPTAFFATNTVDEDNLDIEDLESILDDCLALNMPQSHLLWHYRSRHESLIAFSNSRFYENKLFTFPSVNDRASKVRLIPVAGVFDRGKTRTNKAEAQAVIEEVRRRFRDPELSKQSLGIVTFNISQQHLIDDLLNEACAQDPELEKWAFAAEEPLFIKNLENVQGDERDVILFSIGFGPDEQGKVYMNFGPLNRDGGWRRLNVAVTRARCEMMVFSTLRSDQLDMNRTKAEGVAALRSFLEYAEGRSAAVDQRSLAAADTADGICQSIRNALAAEGFDTDLSVGRSGYRVDIGVVDPRVPEQYLLGIMLDGTCYGSAKTTRDREVAQIGVLKGLGWNILRVWSMDWWDNREKELNRILQTLRDLQNGIQESRQPEEPQTPGEKLQMKAAPKKNKTAPVYKAAVLAQKLLTAEEFTEPRNLRSIQSKINAVISAEGPVSLPVLTRRVVQSFGITRAGSRIQSHMNGILQKMSLQTTEQEGTAFYWKKDQSPDAYALFRVCGDGENRRDIRDIPVQEVANAMYTVLHEQISMGQEDLLRETANKLGYTRLGTNVLSVLALGIAYARTQGTVTTGTGGTLILTPQGTARAETTLESF